MVDRTEGGVGVMEGFPYQLMVVVLIVGEVVVLLALIVFAVLPRDVVSTAAVGLVRSGQEKTTVAGWAGISRTTLDAWLSDSRGS